MATDLNNFFWLTKADRNSWKQNFIIALKQIQRFNPVSINISSIIIWEKTEAHVKYEKRGEISYEHAYQVIEQLDSDQLKVTIYFSLICWRFKELDFESSQVPAALTAWGTEFGKIYDRIDDQSGHLELTIINSGPYCELITDNSNPRIDLVNQKVAENCDQLICLLVSIIENCAIEKMHSYLDICDYVLHNSHLSFYRDSVVFERDLQNYQTDLIAKFHEKNDQNLNNWLHIWRSGEQQNLLNQELKKISKLNTHFDGSGFFLEDIPCDKMKINDGYLFLSYPFFLNKFLSDLYIHLMYYYAK